MEAVAVDRRADQTRSDQARWQGILVGFCVKKTDNYLDRAVRIWSGTRLRQTIWLTRLKRPDNYMALPEQI